MKTMIIFSKNNNNNNNNDDRILFHFATNFSSLRSKSSQKIMNKTHGYGLISAQKNIKEGFGCNLLARDVYEKRCSEISVSQMNDRDL